MKLDLATAFETIYFWSDIDQSFVIYRVLKKGGIFMVCNESNGENDKDKKMDRDYKRNENLYFQRD